MEPVSQVLVGFRSEIEKLAWPWSSAPTAPMPGPMADMVNTLDNAELRAMSDAVHNRFRAAGANSESATDAARLFRRVAGKARSGATTPAEVAGAKAQVRKLLESVEATAPVHTDLRFDKRTGTNIEVPVHQQLPKAPSALANKFRKFVGLDEVRAAGVAPFSAQVKKTNIAGNEPRIMAREGRELARAEKGKELFELAKTEGTAVRDAHRAGGIISGGEAAIDAAKRGFKSLPGWGKAGVIGAGFIGGGKALGGSSNERRGVRLEIR
jgi:hypothetical protein